MKYPVILIFLLLSGSVLCSPAENIQQTAEHPAEAFSGRTEPENAETSAALAGFIAQEKSLSPGELPHKLKRRVDAVTEWVGRERNPLFSFIIHSALAIAAGCGAAWGLHHILIRKKHTPEHAFVWQLVEGLAAPVIILILLMAVFGFLLPVLQSLPQFYLSNARIFFSLMMLTAAWGGVRLVEILADRLRQRQNTLDTLMVHIAAKLMKIALVCAALLFICQRIFNFNITALLAGAGVLGLALAFASKETLANFFGTLMIIFDRPFRIGDRIQTGGIDGIVQSVGMRSTRILTASESVYTVPNSQLESSSIENISHKGVIRYMTTIGIVYESTGSQITQTVNILHQAADNFKGTDRPEYVPRVYFEAFGESALLIKLIVWLKTSDFRVEEEWRTELNTEIFTKLKEAGIGIAYNTCTQYLHTEAGNPLQIAITSGKH